MSITVVRVSTSRSICAVGDDSTSQKSGTNSQADTWAALTPAAPAAAAPTPVLYLSNGSRIRDRSGLCSRRRHRRCLRSYHRDG